MKSILLIFVFCIGISIASAQGTTINPTARAVRGGIRLGGDITQWETLPRYNLILSSLDMSGQKSSGFFTLGWTSKTLLVLGVFEKLSSLSSNSEWWLEESLELFIRVHPDSELIHLSVSSEGEVLNRAVDLEVLETAHRFSEKRWILELAIPLDSIGLSSIETGDTWQFKVARETNALANHAFWPMGKNFMDENMFGIIEFVEVY